MGGIGFSGTTSLYICQKTIDSEEYQKIISTAYLPFHNNSFLLVQDNARPHVSTSSLKFLNDNDVSLLEWPACCPDCNPIENLWAIMVKRVYENSHVFSNVNQLVSKRQNVWDTLSLEEVQNLVPSFPSRLVKVIQSNGGEIDKY